MIRYDEYSRYAYELGFAHGLDVRISPPTACDPFYRLGFKLARAKKTT